MHDCTSVLFFSPANSSKSCIHLTLGAHLRPVTFQCSLSTGSCPAGRHVGQCSSIQSCLAQASATHDSLSQAVHPWPGPWRDPVMAAHCCQRLMHCWSFGIALIHLPKAPQGSGNLPQDCRNQISWSFSLLFIRFLHPNGSPILAGGSHQTSQKETSAETRSLGSEAPTLSNFSFVLLSPQPEAPTTWVPTRPKPQAQHSTALEGGQGWEKGKGPLIPSPSPARRLRCPNVSSSFFSISHGALDARWASLSRLQQSLGSRRHSQDTSSAYSSQVG
jgi:hypothetical protein